MKTALVTGASSEIGRAICLKLKAQGYALICQYSENEQSIILDGKDTEIVSIKADFRTHEGIVGFIDEVHRSAPFVIDVIVHCAAQADKKMETSSEKEIFDVISHVNLFAPIAITRSMVEKMKQSENPSVIFISSANVKHFGSLKNIHYSSTKAALPTIARIFAQEYQPVRSNIITPGYVDTPAYRLGRNEERIEYDKSLALNKRLVSPDEVAETVCLLIANKSMNGTNVHVDGGLYIC